VQHREVEMLGSDILEVVIGLAFAFFILSIVASAGQELISQIVAWRARTLKGGIGKLLADQTFQGLAGQVYAHPLVSALGAPSYLKDTRFADALMETLSTAEVASQTTLDTVVAGIEALPEGDVKTQLRTLVRQGGQTLEDLQKSVATWFDEGMDRLSGAYKRNSQKVLLGLGLAMAVLFNIDALDTAQTLATNPSVRDAIVASATTAVEGDASGSLPQDAITELRGMTPAIGWSVCWYPTDALSDPPAEQMPAPCGVNLGGVWPPFDAWVNYSVLRIPGWLFTGLAVMLGAPFWFDVLTKFVNLRATGAKPK
jgi:hypothetical protein